MAIDYRYKMGIVGQFNGNDVYVIPEKDFDLARTQKNKGMIFALSSGNKELLDLVSDGMWIGQMTAQGQVGLFEKSRFFEERRLADPQLKIDTSSSGITPADIGIRPNESAADRFIRNMKF